MSIDGIWDQLFGAQPDPPALLALVTALSFTDLGLAFSSVIIARLRDLVYFLKELLT